MQIPARNCSNPDLSQMLKLGDIDHLCTFLSVWCLMKSADFPRLVMRINTVRLEKLRLSEVHLACSGGADALVCCRQRCHSLTRKCQHLLRHAAELSDLPKTERTIVYVEHANVQQIFHSGFCASRATPHFSGLTAPGSQTHADPSKHSFASD